MTASYLVHDRDWETNMRKTKNKPDKLNWYQKWWVRKLINTASTKLRKYKLKANEDKKNRIEIENAVLEMGKIFEIEWNTKPIDKKNIKLIKEKELLNIFEATLKMLKKEI